MARIRIASVALVALAGASLAACTTMTPRYAARGPAGTAPPPAGPKGYKTGEPYQVGGIWYVPHEQPNYDQTGTASWYGDAFHLKATANGETFDMNAVSAAHTTLPLPSMVEVTNLENGRKLVVRVNDRGPFVGDRIIDLSREAARQLGYERNGLAKVRVRYVGPAPLAGPAAGVRVAQAPPVSPAPFAPQTSNPIEVASLAPPPGAVGVTPLAPLTGTALGAPATATAAAAQGFRIQAGAFSNESNAQRAAAQLASAGNAVIEPIARGGTTLYRVMLPGPADEAEAYALRDKVALIGFADARVLQPF